MSNLGKYMGYKEEDFKTPYAKYFIENMFPIQPHVLEGLEKSPFPAGKLPPVREAKLLANDEYTEIETGYSLENDGSMRIAILTKMPRVNPQMWDWWFGWHGCCDNRYKLWHPKAHKSAQWKDGKDDETYIGRTSIIQENIGKSLELASISFVSPLTLGFSPRNIENKDKNVFICARVGYTKFPIDFGWLLHQIRATEYAFTRFAMVHYPENYCWGVDNMWTNATITELMPFIKEISETLPPPPSHFLWLNWQPPKRKTKMSFSMEDKLYLALYGAWKNPSETLKYGNWATDLAKKYSHLETGIQLADESLHTRTAKFVSDENLQRLNLIRGKRDEDSLFHEWHSKPKIG